MCNRFESCQLSGKLCCFCRDKSLRQKKYFDRDDCLEVEPTLNYCNECRLKSDTCKT